MRRRWRIWRGNPAANVRLAQAATFGAALFGAIGRGDSSLLNTLALIGVAATGWFEARYADAVGDFLPQAVKRGALARLAAGAALLLAGWWVPGLLGDPRSGWMDALCAGALFAGAALMLGGIARLVMTVGMRYAGRKLQERLDDDF
ncbi:MAG: hypothetical protein IT334_06715 [Thermomicrobiales bacterium]|nr:hypothetical protein [Thermomicrobiales bacterium]